MKIWESERIIHPGWRTVLGGILLHIVIGTMYNWGNIITYVTSYLRVYNPAITYSDTMKIYPISLATHGVVLLISGHISRRIGYRNCCLLGSIVFISGTWLASVSTSLTEFIITQGIMFGIGMGLTYTVPISSAVQWLPHRQGVVSGIIVAGFGCGPFVFGWLSSHLANPYHDEVEKQGVDTSYFAPNSAVVANVPHMYRSLGAIYCVVMLCGALLIAEPPILGPNLQETKSLPTKDLEYNRLHEAHNGQLNHFEQGTTLNDSGHGETEDVEDGESDEKESCDMIKSPICWHLALCIVLTGVGGLYLAVVFKVFAQEYFSSDLYLSVVISTASLFNALGRVFWGFMSDKIGPLRTLIGMSALFAVILLMYPLSAQQGQTIFAFWTFLVFFFEGSNFVVYITLCIYFFGRRNATSNYALLFLVVPIFNFINIYVLADMKVTFSAAARFLSLCAFLGCISLSLLTIHVRNQPRKK